MEPFVRSAYNYDMNQAGDESGLECKDPTLTQQQFKDEVDINTLVERFGLTGTIPQLEHLPSLGDYEGIFDFQTAMNAVVEAKRTFLSMPAKLRARFQNDPQQFVEYFDDEGNREEAEKMGLIAKRPDPEPALAPKAPEKQGDTPKNP